MNTHNPQELHCDHEVYHPDPDPRKDIVVDHEIADTYGYKVEHDCERLKMMRQFKGIKRIFVIKEQPLSNN